MSIPLALADGASEPTTGAGAAEPRRAALALRRSPATKLVSLVDGFLAASLRAMPPHELRRVRFVASLSLLMQLLLGLLAIDGVRRGSPSLWFTVLGVAIWGSILPLLKHGHDRVAGVIAVAYPQLAMLFIMLHRDSVALASDPWQGVMILSATYLVGTRFGVATLLLVLTEMVLIPFLAQHGWLINSPFEAESPSSAEGKGPAFMAIFGMAWLYSSARDAADRSVEASHQILLESREEFRSLVEQTHTVPLRIDAASQTLVYVGPQAGELLGCPPAQWLTPGFIRARTHPDDQAVLDTFNARGGSSVPWEAEYRLRHADDSWRWVRVILSACKPGASQFHGVMLDVTHRRRLEVDLQQAQKLESVGRLASGIAHEINTPIQFVGDGISYVKDAFRDLLVLLGSYHRLKEQAAQGPVAAELLAEITEAEQVADLGFVVENVPAALDRSIEGVRRVADLVKSMKEFAHPDRRERAPADLNQALASNLTIAKNEYKYVADVETDYGDLPPLSCHVSELNQVFLNLLVNAAQAVEEAVAGTGRRGRIRVATRCENDEIVVSLSDTGVGIPDSIRAMIFDPFFTTKAVGKGTGQGLAIARNIVVNQHGGRIEVESEVGRGTTFTLRLPLNAAPPPSSPPPLPAGEGRGYA